MSNIQSEELRNGRRRKDTAMLDGRMLNNMQSPFEQFLAIALLVLSFAGAILAFNKGQFWPLTWYAIIGGVLLQVIITWLEWVYHPVRNGINRWYVGAFLFGAGSTAIGFGPILLPSLVGVCSGLGLPMVYGVPGATLAGGTILVALSAILEIAPESILVD